MLRTRNHVTKLHRFPVLKLMRPSHTSDIPDAENALELVLPKNLVRNHHLMILQAPSDDAKRRNSTSSEAIAKGRRPADEPQTERKPEKGTWARR